MHVDEDEEGGAVTAAADEEDGGEDAGLHLMDDDMDYDMGPDGLGEEEEPMMLAAADNTTTTPASSHKRPALEAGTSRSKSSRREGSQSSQGSGKKKWSCEVR